MSARRILAAPDIVVGMLTIGLLGLLFDYIFRVLERRLYARTA
jgi:ABC-type nitrate/sulfonate/bicarbonate transport system permease component